MKQMIGRLAERLARWAGVWPAPCPEPEPFDIPPIHDQLGIPGDVLDLARETVQVVGEKEAGQSGDYKRHMAYLQLCRLRNDVPRRVLGLALEVALWQLTLETSERPAS